MRKISINDTHDTFVMEGSDVRLVMSDSVVAMSQKDELHAFITIAAQMFYDHEDGFSEVDREKTRKARALFDQLEALYS